jgi:DNA mismatch endonuclease (patch repair protein)
MDDRSPEKRSATMRAVKSERTKIEQDFIGLLHSKNFTGIENFPKDIIGKPDVVHRDSKVAVFIDGCFWHGCTKHLRMPATNKDYWEQKISRNRNRDKKNNKVLSSTGWLVVRIWEHSFKSSRLMKWWMTRIENHIKRRAPLQPESP